MADLGTLIILEWSRDATASPCRCPFAVVEYLVYENIRPFFSDLADGCLIALRQPSLCYRICQVEVDSWVAKL